MRFAVLINGKKYPVTVMREPNNSSALSNFKYEGKTYRGVPEQFNSLRFDKVKEKYVAVSIVVTEQVVPVYENVKAEVEDESVLEIQITTPEDIAKAIAEDIDAEPTTKELEEDIEEPEDNIDYLEVDDEAGVETDEEKNELQERKLEFLQALQNESRLLEESTRNSLEKINRAKGFKRQSFSPRWEVLFPSQPSFGEGMFARYKSSWIRAHGSEHLQMTHQMQIKCDSLYIQERASKEFDGWCIDCLLVYYEVDSPDFGVLTFLKNFRELYRDIINQYHSKILLATTEEMPDEENPVVVISDYLGHCDLSIPLVDLVDKYGDKC